MKKLVLFLTGTVLALNLQATHHLTYFVYVESVFQQGYWKDADRVTDHQGVFLYPYKYTDLFGTVKEDFYNKMLTRLKSHHDFYQQVALDSNVLKQDGYREYYDTLNFAVQAGLSQQQLKTIRNELTATVLTAGESDAIRLNHYDREGMKVKTETLDFADLDYPMFELAGNKEKETVHDTIYQTRTDTVRLEHQPTSGDTESATCWDRYVWLGIILLLGILIIHERRKNRA
jgi:hypothetical protein